LGIVSQDAHGYDIPLSVPEMREQANDRKLIQIFRQRLKAELFVPFIPLQDEILRRAVTVRLEHRNVRMTTAEDLILLKMTFAREKDIRDIRGILWVQRGNLNLDYLRTWSGRMLEDHAQQELENLIQEYQAERT
jgi:predicted nucleotidyltransferase